MGDTMIACVDVDYRDDAAVAACVLFDEWAAERSSRELVARVADTLPYEPGRFYRRELPPILAVLEQVEAPLDAVVVDGHVWLRGKTPGLGAKLYEALDGAVPVIGVAKNPFAGTDAVPVYRGRSRRPLFVTATGMAQQEAAQHIQRMHGPYRIPTMLREADRLCRTG